MVRYLVAIMAVVAGVAASASAQAQSSCYDEVLRSANNPALRVQSNMGGLTDSSRENARVHYWRALVAAERGYEAECRAQLGWGNYFVKPPKPSG